MASHVKTVRAIGAEFLRRKLLTFAIIAAILVTLAIATSIWLAASNAWWTILLIVVLIWSAVIQAILLGAYWAIKLFRPELSSAQKIAVSGFVEKLERLAEAAGTPPFIVFCRVLRDVLWPREEGYIRSIAKDSLSLQSDYIALSKQLQ